MEAEAAVAARFPTDVFVVLLKPRVNYARGINERPEQRAIGSKSGQLGSEQSKWSSTRVVPMWNISGNLTTARSKAQSLNSITETKTISMKQKRGWWSIDSMDDYSDSIIFFVFRTKTN